MEKVGPPCCALCCCFSYEVAKDIEPSKSKHTRNLSGCSNPRYTGLLSPQHTAADRRLREREEHVCSGTLESFYWVGLFIHLNRIKISASFSKPFMMGVYKLTGRTRTHGFLWIGMGNCHSTAMTGQCDTTWRGQVGNGKGRGCMQLVQVCVSFLSCNYLCISNSLHTETLRNLTNSSLHTISSNVVILSESGLSFDGRAEWNLVDKIRTKPSLIRADVEGIYPLHTFPTLHMNE